MSTGSHYRGGNAGAGPPVRVDLAELRAHCAAVLVAGGLAPDAAGLVADSLVDAEARGISSHGVTRTRIYTERLRAGMIDGAAEPSVVRRSNAAVHLDAGNAVGHVGARAGLEHALELAGANGVGAAGVGGSNHCGTLAYFSRRGAEAGFVVLAMSTAPPTMVYYGGRSRAVGTNPLSLAVPRRDGPPIALDMATSATARGKIILANQLGQEIPEGWAVDADGRPTTDAAAALAGSVVPFGGPKGSALAMMIDLLAGALVAGAAGSDIGDMYEDWSRAQRVGHLMIALDPAAWLGRDAFAEQVERFVARVHDLPPADGFAGVLLPGEVEERALAAATSDGVRLSGTVHADLLALAEEVGLDRRPEVRPDP